MQVRFLKHLCQILAFIGIPFLYNHVVVFVHGDQGDAMAIGISILFLVINNFRLTFDYKIYIWLSLFLALLIILASYFLTFFLIRHDAILPNDPFAIISMIIHNSIHNVIFFEITYHLKNLIVQKRMSK
jgi:hypothetical protein